MLHKLVSAGGHELRHSVISLQTKGTIGPKLEDAGAIVVALNLSGGRVPGFPALALVSHLRALQPDLIQGWMYHGNVAASVARTGMRKKPALCWSIRCSLNETRSDNWLTRTIVQIGGPLSRNAGAILYNSDRSRRQHEAIGYNPRRSVVIPNGFDVEALHPSPQLKQSMRQDLGIPEDAIVFGMLARLHPMKDHGSFLATAVETIAQTHNTYFVAAGRDVPSLRETNSDLTRKAGTRLILLPEQPNVVQFMNGLDVCLLNSAAEGFPNVLGEAMACGVPCITSDVGDCAAIVGNTGLVVPPRSPQETTAAALHLLRAGAGVRYELGQLARQRVIDLFSLDSVAERYKSQWIKVAASSGRTAEVGH